MLGMAAALLMPNAENCTLEEIQVAAAAAPNHKTHLRYFVLRILLLGKVSKPNQCEMFALKLNTLNAWIRRLNARGPEGLRDQSPPGRPTKIPPAQQAAFKDLLRHPHVIGRDFWTARVRHGHLAKEWQIEMGYSTACASMHAANCDLKSARPWPGLRQDPGKRAAYLEALKALLAEANLELWYGDETGIEGDHKPRRRWAAKGVKTTVPYTGEHLRENVIGAVCPRSGELFCHVVPWVDSEWFGLFLKGLASVTRERQRRAGRSC